jgi:preprotein translocase subunit SecB
MSNEKTENQQPEAAQPAVLIHNQYIKDFSFEIPHAPEIFGKLTQQPELKIDLNIENKPLENGLYNVTLNIALEGNVAEEKLFILELAYAAVVALNVPQEHREPVLAIEIPRLLFPFVRNIVTQSLLEGGLPPVMLSPIDFASLYARRAQAANQNA